MARGQSTGVTLVNFMTKLEPSTKGMIDALVKVQKKAGIRELLNAMLETYAEKYPEDFAKAQQLVDLLGDM